MHMRAASLLITVALCLGICSSWAIAQTATSQITGVVTDPTGAVVPGAAVAAINEATGVAIHQTTTGAGVFQFSAVPPGRYTLTIEATGFKSEKRTGIVVEVGTPATVNIGLQVGGSTETVEVTAAPVTLNTNNATLGQVITTQAVDKLPLNGRNPLMLVTLQAGVVQTTSGSINVNGGRSVATNVTIDGIEANESSAPNFTKNLYGLNPDNVQEFKVTTSNPDAQEGRNSGANVSIATRSGTNEFHGSVYEFFRNTDLNAANFWDNAQGNEKQQIHMNQYGFNLGGPIKKDKTFFYGSYQGQYVNIAQPIDQAFGSVPTLYTPTAQQGIFRYFVVNPSQPFYIGSTKITGNSPLLVNPQTGALVPGVRNCNGPTDSNCVASFNIGASDPLHIGLDPLIAKQLASYPAVNTYATGDGLNTGGYFWNSPFQIRGPVYMARVDHTFDENNMIFARYMYAQSNTFNGDPVNGDPQVLPGLPPLGESIWPAHNAVISYRHVFSPTTMNELTLGFSRLTELFTQGQANPAFPNIPAYSFNLPTTPYWNAPLVQRKLTTPQIVDNFSVVKGSHIISAGINLRMYEHNDLRGSANGYSLTPSISLSATTRPPSGFGLPAVAGTAPGISSTDLSHLQSAINDLLGIPATLTQRFLGDLNANNFLPFMSNGQVTMYDEGNRLKQYDSYLQDVWKIRRNLTLTFGARWEVNLAPTEAAGRVYVPDRPIDGSQGPVTFVHADAWYPRNNLGAIAPRFSLAWAPGSGRTVIRTGYGMAFDTISSLVVTAVASGVPGLVGTCSNTLSASGVKTTPGCGSVPDLRLGQGFPEYLPAPTLQPSSYLTPTAQLRSNAPSITEFAPNMKLPTVHEWNFTIQHQFSNDFVLSVGYIGKRGTRLYRNYNINQVDAGPILPSFLLMEQNVAANCKPDGTGCPAGVTGATIPIVAQGIVSSSFVNSSTTMTDLKNNAAGNFAGRIDTTTLAANLRPNPQFNIINYLDNSGDSYYHSLQASIQRRFSGGLLLGASYTLSKSIDDGSSDPGGAGASSGSAIDIHNWRDLRSLSDFDRRHVLTVSSVYELPFGKGKRFLNQAPRFVNGLVSGWGLNGLGTFQSGQPFSVSSGAYTNNASHQSYAALSSATLPEAKVQDQAGIVGPVLFTSTEGFMLPAPGSNGAGRNLFTGPSFWNVDLSASKAFDLTERFHLVFRTEAFNVFNHTNFTTGNLNILSSNFGQALGAVSTAGTRNVIRTGEPGRVIQLALRLSF